MSGDSSLVGNPKTPLEDALVPQFVDLVDDETLLYTWPPHVPFEYSAKAYLDGKHDDLHEWLMKWVPTRRSGLGMLDTFIRIHSASDILEFTERFGVLGWCDHFLPSTHQNRAPTSYGEMCEPMRFPFSGFTPVHWEPVKPWIDLAAGARSLLKITSAIYQGIVVDAADWESAISPVSGPYPPGLYSVMTSPESQRGTVSFLVEEWLALGGASHGLIWTDHSETPEIRLLVRDTGQPPTVAILASQLMLAIARASDLTVCSGCVSIYRRERKPQSRRRNYCPDCQLGGIPNRERQRAHRAKLPVVAK